MGLRSKSYGCTLFCCLAFSSVGFSLVDLSRTAEYYLARREYRQALQIWEKTLKSQPKSVSALVRVSELKLLFEGREAVRDQVIAFLESNGAKLSSSDRKQILAEFTRLQSVFVSDNGQAAFLKALTRIQANDCSGALPYLSEALGLEKGNVKILMEKAKCEQSSKLYSQAYESLKQAGQMQPYFPELLEELAESHLYHDHPDQVVLLFKGSAEKLTTLRHQTAYAMALFLEKRYQEALPLLNAIVSQKHQVEIHPILYYALGTLLSQNERSSEQGKLYLNKFLKVVTGESSDSAPHFDPYHSETFVAHAEQLLKEKTPS